MTRCFLGMLAVNSLIEQIEHHMRVVFRIGRCPEPALPYAMRSQFVVQPPYPMHARSRAVTLKILLKAIATEAFARCAGGLEFLIILSSRF
jgi:hypothetical protein